MKLSDLREVQNRERSTDSLQELPDSFYADVAEYIGRLKAERERAADRADDPFDDPDVDRLTDEISSAEQVVEAIYERRVGKIVKQASFAAAGMSGDVDGLTVEERRLYEDITDRIVENKQQALETHTEDDPPEGGPPGGDSGRGPEDDVGDPGDRPAGNEPAPEEAALGAGEVFEGDLEADSPEEAGPAEPESEPAADGGAAPRSTVRITDEIGEVFGVDERVYRLEAEDVVSLPSQNADALVAKDAAERL